jgi:Tetratricopeptide repeat
MKITSRAAALLFALAIAPGVALADPSDADKATARELGIDGYKALAAKDYAGALDRFKRADTLFHAPTITLGLARAQVGLGKLVAAQEIYNKLAHEDLPPKASTALKKAVKDAQTELAALSPRIPGVIIDVKGAASLKVSLDGAEVPAAALGVKRPADPGEHVVRAEAKGLADREVKVTLAEGKVETVSITLEPPRAAPPKPEPPAVPPPMPAAKPPLVASPPVTPGAPAPAVADMPPAQKNGSGRRTAGIIIGAGGLVGLGIGGAFGAIAISKKSGSNEAGRCDSNSFCDDTGKALRLDAFHAATASTIGFVAGGVMLAGGVVLFATAPSGSKSTTVSLGPGNVSFEGRF